LTKTRPAWWIEAVNAPGAPVPWHKIDPWEEVWPEEPEESDYGELPMTLGPAKSSSRKPPFFGTINPFTGKSSGSCESDLLELLRNLNWC
jgi:hypothetical protein